MEWINNLYENEGQEVNERRVSPTERRKEGKKSILDSVWFSRMTVVLEAVAMTTGGISHIGYISVG